MYGYVQPPRGRGGVDFNAAKIHIERLGVPRNALSIDGILVAWVARNPNGGGTYVAGWYDDATIFRYWQEPPQGSNRTFNNEPLGYYVKAKEKNCVLLPIEKRTLQIARGKGYMGQANIWYPDEGFERRLIQLIKKL